MALNDDQTVQTIRDLIGLDDGPFNFSKADIRAAVAAVDEWVGANAASLNSALPQPFRGQANVSQKAALLAFVALRRAGR